MRRVLPLALVLAVFTVSAVDAQPRVPASGRDRLIAASPHGETLFSPAAKRSGREFCSTERAWRLPDRIFRNAKLAIAGTRVAHRPPPVPESHAFHCKQPLPRSSHGDSSADH